MNQNRGHRESFMNVYIGVSKNGSFNAAKGCEICKLNFVSMNGFRYQRAMKVNSCDPGTPRSDN